MEDLAPAGPLDGPRRLAVPADLAGDPALRSAADGAGLQIVAEDCACDLRLIGPQELESGGPRALRRHRMRCAESLALVVHSGSLGADGVRECFREGAVDVVSLPNLAAELPDALARLLRRQGAGRSEDAQMRGLASQLGRRARDLERALAALRASYEETLSALVAALDCREKETAFHSQRVAGYALQLGVRVGLHGTELENLYRGALLHDIGKIGIPDAILLKPGKLTPEEWDVMRTHAALGAELLGGIGFLRGASDVPRCHHEAWDGTGYPARLAREAIPLSARLFAIVDSYDAIRSKRPYKEAEPHGEALARLRTAAGQRLDPERVDLFCLEPEATWSTIAEATGHGMPFEDLVALCGAELAV